MIFNDTIIRKLSKILLLVFLNIMTTWFRIDFDIDNGLDALGL